MIYFRSFTDVYDEFEENSILLKNLTDDQGCAIATFIENTFNERMGFESFYFYDAQIYYSWANDRSDILPIGNRMMVHKDCLHNAEFRRLLLEILL